MESTPTTKRRTRKAKPQAEAKQAPPAPAPEAPPAEAPVPPATTPANNPPAIFPTKQGCCKIWLACTDDRGNQELYQLRRIHDGSTHDGVGEAGWEMTKYSDGTKYHVHEGPHGMHCDCPGGTFHGPSCNGGKGCKHARLLRHLRDQSKEPGEL